MTALAFGAFAALDAPMAAAQVYMGDMGDYECDESRFDPCFVYADEQCQTPAMNLYPKAIQCIERPPEDVKTLICARPKLCDYINTQYESLLPKWSVLQCPSGRQPLIARRADGLRYKIEYNSQGEMSFVHASLDENIKDAPAWMRDEVFIHGPHGFRINNGLVTSFVYPKPTMKRRPEAQKLNNPRYLSEIKRASFGRPQNRMGQLAGNLERVFRDSTARLTEMSVCCQANNGTLQGPRPEVRDCKEYGIQISPPPASQGPGHVPTSSEDRDIN